MTFQQEYLEADKRTKFNLLRTYLHIIKFESEEDCFDLFGAFDFSAITPDNLTDLVQLTVYIEHAMGKRFRRIPRWCRDPRLTLDEPYKGRGYNEAWFFHAPQACMTHNFFIDPGALEVM